MRLVVYLGEVLEIKVSVDLGRGDVGVPQELLDGTQIGTGCPKSQKVSAEAQSRSLSHSSGGGWQRRVRVAHEAVGRLGRVLDTLAGELGAA